MADTNKQKNTAPKFPASVLVPVSNFLTARLHILEKRKRDISKEDPFKDTSRVNENADPGDEASEQSGHARASAIGSEISKRIIQVRKALTRIRVGKYGICEECGQMIDTDRLIIYPEATLCARDAKRREK